METAQFDIDYELAQSIETGTKNNENLVTREDILLSNGTNEKEFLNEFSHKKLKQEKILQLEQAYSVNNRQIVRKIDLCLLPACCLLFFISWFNKSLFGYFMINGMTSINVGISRLGYTYTAYFIPYMVLQIFSNLFLKYLRPHFWISITVILYGVVAIGSAYAKSYGVFVFCACIHGLLQAGTETATYYILAHYYAKPESQKRFSLIYSMSSISGIVLALINYGVANEMVNKRGLETWQWLSIIVGTITIFSGCILFFTFPDFPEGARFFNDNESLFLIKKLELYGGNSGYGLKADILTYFKTLIDPLIWMPILMSFFTAYACYGMTAIQPVYINSSGFVQLELARRAIYCWVAAILWSIINSVVSDFLNIRLPFVVVNLLIAASCTIGFFDGATMEIMYRSNSRFSIFLVIFATSFAAMPLIICWTTMNLLGHLRRSLAVALEIAASSLGAISAYWSLFKPMFNLANPYAGIGFTQSSVFLYLAAGFALIYSAYLFFLNKSKESNKYIQNWNAKTNKQRIIFGDKNPHFKYSY